MTPRDPGTARRLAAMLDPAILPSYATSGARSLRRGIVGQHRHPGDARAVCRAILEDCWTGLYFNASAGHFRQFWIRDLGFSCGPLIRLGHGARVEASIAWALEAWARHGRVTTTIFPGRRPREVYTLGIDSLPLCLHVLRSLGAVDLVERHAGWLGREIRRFAREVVDARTGLVRSDRSFSSHRDTVRVRSNCYANTMLALLAVTLHQTGWFPCPVPSGARDRFIAAFWHGDRFVEERGGTAVSGDAVVFPFWLDVVDTELGLSAALRAAYDEGLATPLPLRYATRRDARAEDPVQRLFVPDYQGSSIWTSLGAIYLSLLDRVDPDAARPWIAAYAGLVERDGTFWEVLGADLRPYRGRLGIFHADEAMLWSAIFLDLLERAIPAP